jgi:hypothetical protein
MSQKKEEIVGRIIDSSESQLYRDFKKAPKAGFFHLLIRQEDGKIVKIYLSDEAMGLQNFNKSIVYFINKKTGELVKTGIVNPRKFVGSKVSVKGVMDKSKVPYYMNRVVEFVLLYRE